MNIYSPLEKTYFDVTIRQHREFFNNKLQHSCSPLVIVQHVRSNESTRNLLCLFLSFSLFSPLPLSLSTNSPLNINPSEKLLSPFTVRTGRNRALSETGYRSPFPSLDAVQFSLPLPPPEKLPFHFGRKETSYFNK